MTPRLEACYFNAGPDGCWSRMAAVLEASAREHCQGWRVTVERRPGPGDRSSILGIQRDVFNTVKLERWAEIIAAATEGDQIALVDVDTVLLGPLDSVWDRAFDLAFTWRSEGARFPLAAGVVFVRVSLETQAFFTIWARMCARMLQDAELHQYWRRHYGGINQAALGAVLAGDGARGLARERLGCAEWNCEDSSWSAFDSKTTRILHLHGPARAAAFRTARVTDGIAQRVASVWCESERAYGS